jgi:hypothetical protein
MSRVSHKTLSRSKKKLPTTSVTTAAALQLEDSATRQANKTAVFFATLENGEPEDIIKALQLAPFNVHLVNKFKQIK